MQLIPRRPWRSRWDSLKTWPISQPVHFTYLVAKGNHGTIACNRIKKGKGLCLGIQQFYTNPFKKIKEQRWLFFQLICLTQLSLVWIFPCVPHNVSDHSFKFPGVVIIPPQKNRDKSCISQVTLRFLWPDHLFILKSLHVCWRQLQFPHLDSSKVSYMYLENWWKKHEHLRSECQLFVQKGFVDNLKKTSQYCFCKMLMEIDLIDIRILLIYFKFLVKLYKSNTV